MGEDAGQTAAEGFVHLRVRSAYSLLEGAIKTEQIGKLAAAAGMPAAALTDRANLFGALEFSVECKDTGVQPIIGCALPVTGIGEGRPERWARTPTVVLLAQNETGYRNLTILSSMAYLESDGLAEPSVPWTAVADHAEGLILLVRRLRRAGRPPVRPGPRPRGGGRAQRDASGVRRPLLCRAAASRPGRPGRRRAGAGGLRL